MNREVKQMVGWFTVIQVRAFHCFEIQFANTIKT